MTKLYSLLIKTNNLMTSLFITFQLRDEGSSDGDLGIGDKGQPMRLRVNFGSPTGEHV